MIHQFTHPSIHQYTPQYTWLVHLPDHTPINISNKLPSWEAVLWPCTLLCKRGKQDKSIKKTSFHATSLETCSLHWIFGLEITLPLIEIVHRSIHEPIHSPYGTSNRLNFLSPHILTCFAWKCPKVDRGSNFFCVYHSIINKALQNVLHWHGGDSLLFLTLLF